MLQECGFTSRCIWANKYDIYQPILIEHILCITSTVLSDLASLVISSPFYQRGLKRLKHRPMSHNKYRVEQDSATDSLTSRPMGQKHDSLWCLVPSFPSQGETGGLSQPQLRTCPRTISPRLVPSSLFPSYISSASSSTRVSVCKHSHNYMIDIYSS